MIEEFDVNISPENFDALAIKTFHHQAKNVAVYRDFLKLMKVNLEAITTLKALEQIPFLPISFFKTHKIIEDDLKPEIIFESSGTTGENTSRHFVYDSKLYEKTFLSGFNKFYGEISDYCILCLLPAYLERKGSSLIYMCDRLIKESQHSLSGFYLYEIDKLIETIQQLNHQKQKTILIGVTFALLDLAEKLVAPFNETGNFIVMETGGMKGRRKELVREELHPILCSRLGVTKIHSEYGMTEMLSQAYSKGDGIFYSSPTMKILIRDVNDATTILQNEQTGGINVIDLANRHSCSFIATQDLGKTFADGTFQVLGRFDNSDLRGCNLLIS